MSVPKNKCKICGFEDEITNQPGGICQECGENDYTTIKLSKFTKSLLDAEGKKSDSYDDIIKTLLFKSEEFDKMNRGAG